MSSHDQIVQLLNEELTRLRNRNTRYSLRAFAKRLKLWPSTVSEILKGQRKITRKMGHRILQQLEVDPQTSAMILRDLRGKYTHRLGTFREVDVEHFHLIGEWQHYGIISLSETEDFRDDPVWISQRLGLSLETTQNALDRLERLGLLKRNEEGRLTTTNAQLTTTQDVVSAAVKMSHEVSLGQAQRALNEQDILLRDFSAMTMAIDPAKIPEAKKRIEKFRRELCAFLESGEKKEVYKVAIQLFSLSQNVEPEESIERCRT